MHVVARDVHGGASVRTIGRDRVRRDHLEQTEHRVEFLPPRAFSLGVEPIAARQTFDTAMIGRTQMVRWMASLGQATVLVAAPAGCGGQVAGDVAGAPIGAVSPPQPPTLVSALAPTAATGTQATPGQVADEPPVAGVAAVVESAPALPPGPHVRVGEFVAALELVAVELEEAPALEVDYRAWLAQHGLSASDALWHDYVRVRMVFECVRDGGLWQLRWAITNEEPRSDEIWAQWAKLEDFDPAAAPATATAECDELSALFAYLVRRLGVRNVGLFWPVWNHVVAVWTIEGDHGPVRVVVPTSQIFLDRDASLGTDGFNAWKQKTIYEYRRRDVRDDARLPAGLARFFIDRAWSGLDRSQAELQTDRNTRSDRLGGS